MVHRHTQFVSLDRVLCEIADHTNLPDRVRLVTPDGMRQVTPDDLGALRDPCEKAARYSKAASLLNRDLQMTSAPLRPQWLDYRGGTGYPLPTGAAREDGMEFLREQAKWYWQWEEFDKSFHVRRMAAEPEIPSLNGGGLRMISLGNRWRTQGLTAADYARECPQQPVNTPRYLHLVVDVGFDLTDMVAFLDRVGIPRGPLSAPPSESVVEPSVPVSTEDVRIKVEAADPPPVGTKLIALLFYKFRHRGASEGGEERWKKTLSDPPAGLKSARVGKSSQGMGAMWDPVVVASWLHVKGNISLVLLDAVFERQASLKAWRTIWEREAERLRNRPDFTG
ncbi:hypothetical protein [Pararobbsia alpina]|uniref:Uncharacterized protein n=1 Tax=Pararobbsia alpina TaxID=621374 RepID=A0A6S7AU71_9BURK|nr:hypothetical protein [Pararobbsia alpina]CAB3778282.1 hypothetical protein LMG28138_00445 [Pararobbsia alpina]